MFYSISQYRDRDQSIQDEHDAELEAAREADSFSFGLTRKFTNTRLECSMKLFRLDEYVWYCGEDAQDAILAYMADTGISREEATDDMYFCEVTGDDLDRMIVDEEDESNNQTMRAAVAAMTAPGFVCGIES